MAKTPFPAGLTAYPLSFPLGRVVVLVDGKGRVAGVAFEVTGRPPVEALPPGRVPAVVRECAGYLAGRRRGFFPRLGDLSRHSQFDRAVWRAARDIPPGQTRTYGQLAAAIGRPGAARAVGGALGRNPVPLAIPCHRVVAADGSPGGFSSGLAVKRWLLALEGWGR